MKFIGSVKFIMESYIRSTSMDMIDEKSKGYRNSVSNINHILFATVCFYI